jgi:hypothetical protein
MTIPDPLATLRTIIGLDAGVLGLLGGDATRVFIGELPREQAALMPRACVLVQPSGGLPEPSYMQLARPRVDVRAYGRTPNEAWVLSLALHDLLKNLQRRNAAASSSGTKALIHSASLSGGPSLLRDADGDWPMALRTYELLVAEVAVP